MYVLDQMKTKMNLIVEDYWKTTEFKSVCLKKKKKGCLTSVVFISPVSTSHTRMVWSQEALQTSSLSLHRTEEMASLCPDNVIRGVCENIKTFYSNISSGTIQYVDFNPSIFIHYQVSHRLTLHSLWSVPAVESSVSSSACHQVLQTLPLHLWVLTTEEKCWSLTKIWILFSNDNLIILGTYLLTIFSTFCPRSHCRTERNQCKHYSEKWKPVFDFYNVLFSVPPFTFDPVGSVATVSTLPACPRQQCLAFNLFFSEFHSHSRMVWSRDAVRSREVRPSAQKTTTEMFSGCDY